MSRWIAILGCAFAVTLAVSFAAPTSFEAEAAKKPKNKQCMATQLNGQKATFKCKADEKCCFDYVANKGNCVAAGAVCL